MKKITKRLSLSRDTVRHLVRHELDGALGGAKPQSGYPPCLTTFGACPTNGPSNNDTCLEQTCTVSVGA